MANTSNLKDRAKRKRAKQAKRRELKALYAQMSRKERAEFWKAGGGIRAFLAKRKAATPAPA